MVGLSYVHTFVRLCMCVCVCAAVCVCGYGICNLHGAFLQCFSGQLSQPDFATSNL